jgi:hypothetical protein
LAYTLTLKKEAVILSLKPLNIYKNTRGHITRCLLFLAKDSVIWRRENIKKKGKNIPVTGRGGP